MAVGVLAYPGDKPVVTLLQVTPRRWLDQVRLIVPHPGAY